MSSITKEQCIEFAKLDKLRLHHWRLLTGVTVGKDNSFVYSQEGVFPVQYTDEELSGLTADECFLIGEFCASEPLLFPCLPSQLIRFVDDLVLGDFSVPDAFRGEVERLNTSEAGIADGDFPEDDTNRLTVKKTIAPYVANLKKRFPKLTGKLLHSEAEKEAGSESSPFAAHKWGESLQLKECHRACSLATFEQVLSQIKK